MALELSIAILEEEGCSTALFRETTPTDETGYGGSNPEITDILTAALVITFGDDVLPYTYDFTMDGDTISGYTITREEEVIFTSESITLSYPLVDFEISAEELDLTALPDGKVEFSYELTFAGDVVETTAETKLFVCETDCCVTKMAIEVASCSCDCMSKKNRDLIFKAAMARTLLDSAVYMAYIQNIDDAVSTLECVKLLCSETCSSC